MLSLVGKNFAIMIKEEEIKEAYKDYMNNGGMLQSNPWFAFKAGAEWVHTHSVIWHNASEEPQDKDKRILTYSKLFDYFSMDFPNYLMVKYGGQFKDWETVVLRNKISKWAYLKDLKPKTE